MIPSLSRKRSDASVSTLETNIIGDQKKAPKTPNTMSLSQNTENLAKALKKIPEKAPLLESKAAGESVEKIK